VTQATSAIVRRVVAAALSVVVLGVLGTISARAADDGDLTTVQVRPNFYLIVGDGQNIGVQVGEDGVVVVNAGTKAGADGLIAAVKKISPQPIRYVMDTSADADVVGGNELVAAAGETLFAAPKGPGAEIFASASVLEKLGQMSDFPTKGWPTDTYLPNEPIRTFEINNEPVIVSHASSADSDSFVLFRRSDVVMAGDVMDDERFPVIDMADGGTIDGEIAALNDLMRIAVPPTPLIYTYDTRISDQIDSGTYVIPAHGRVGDQWEVNEYRDMIVIIRNTVDYMMKRHMSLEQIEAAHPAKAYEPRYGSTTGPWTTNMFIDAIYKSLQASAKASKKIG
jgi:glyoxylase-like metal-dependent hydrolase (beta-lactamase superfamily II)